MSFLNKFISNVRRKKQIENTNRAFIPAGPIF